MTKKILVIAGLNPHENALMKIFLDGEAHTMKDLANEHFLQAAKPYVDKKIIVRTNTYSKELFIQAHSIVRNSLRKLRNPPRGWVWQCGIGTYQITGKGKRDLHNAEVVEYPQIEWNRRLNHTEPKNHNVKIKFADNIQQGLKRNEQIQPIHVKVPKRKVPKKPYGYTPAWTVETETEEQARLAAYRKELDATLKPRQNKEGSVTYAKKAARKTTRK